MDLIYVINKIISDIKGRSAINSVFWILVEKFIKILLGLFLLSYLTRYLGVENYGLYSYVISFVAVLSPLSSLGLEETLVHQFISNKKDSFKIISTSFYLRVIGFFLMFLITIIILYFSNLNQSTNTLIIVFTTATFFSSFAVIEYFLLSVNAAKEIFIARTISYFLNFLFVIFCICFQKSLIWIIGAFLLQNITYAGLLLFNSRKMIKFNFYIFDYKIARKLLLLSAPLMFSAFSFYLQSNIDQIMLKEMLGLTELGMYSTAFNLLSMFVFIPNIFQRAFFPSIINLKNKSKNLFYSRIQDFYKFLFILFLFSVLPFIFFSNQISFFFFGNEFSETPFILSILSFRLLYVYFNVARVTFFISIGMQKFILFTIFISSIINIILNYYLIPIYGVYGAIFSTYLSSFLDIFFLDVFFKKSRQNSKMIFNSIFSFWKISFLNPSNEKSNNNRC